MANPTRFPVFREGDLGIKDGPVDGAALREAFRKLFGQLNPGLDAANRGTSKGLTLADNIKCDIITGTFTHGVAQNFALTNLTKANSARILSCDSQIPAGAPAIQMVSQSGGGKPTAAVTLFFNNSMNASGAATSSKATLELLSEGAQNSSVPTFLPTNRGFGAAGGSSTLTVAAAGNVWTDIPNTNFSYIPASASRSAIAVLAFAGYASGAAGALQARILYGAVASNPFGLFYNTMLQHQSWTFQNAALSTVGGPVGAAYTIKAQILCPTGSAAGFNMDTNDAASLVVQEVG